MEIKKAPGGFPRACLLLVHTCLQQEETPTLRAYAHGSHGDGSGSGVRFAGHCHSVEAVMRAYSIAFQARCQDLSQRAAYLGGLQEICCVSG